MGVDNGGSWSEVFSTSVNSLFNTRISLGSSTTSKIKIVMLENHPLHGVINGQAVYGIASLDLNANGMTTIVEECSVAAKSADCRDKYFLSYVGEFDPFPARTLRGELPGLEAAQTSLAGATAELAEAVSKLDSCGAFLVAVTSVQQNAAAAGIELLDEPSSLNAASARDLLREARTVIVRMRSSLNSR